MKVLVIDDDQTVAGIWRTVFTQEGFEFFHALTGKAGIEDAKKDLPDIILLDQIMPDAKGNDILLALKSDPQTKAIPVALVSNYNETQMMNDAIAQGAVDYILKYQIEPQDLVKKVKSLIQEAKGNTLS